MARNLHELFGLAVALSVTTVSLAGGGSPEPAQRNLEGRFYTASQAEIEVEQAFLARIADVRPDLEKWYFMDKVEVDLEAPRAEFDPDYNRPIDPKSGKEEPGPNDDLAMMALPDGRVFAQHGWTAAPKRTARSGRTMVVGAKSAVGPDNADSAGLFDDDSGAFEVPAGLADPKQLVGSDQRLRSTSSAAGHRGVMVRIQSGSTSNAGFCSGSMISPRVVLTAAHCITDDDGNFDRPIAYVAPVARGASYTGTRRPQGAHLVIRFVWPSGWSGSGGAKYDYALLVLSDLARDTSGSIQWDPRPAFVGYQTSSWIESKNFNLRGYPAWYLSCADAAPGDGGLCNGYGFYQWPAMHIDYSHSTWLSHSFDTQPAQSGAPLYYYSGGERTVYAVHKGEYFSRNRAHKIRSGSFGLMCDVIEDYPSSHFTNFHCD